MADGPDAARYADAVLARSRAGIARAITLVESSRPDHRILAQHVLTRLLPHAGDGPAGRHHRRPRRRQVHLHRRPRRPAHRPGAPGRGAGGRPVVDPQRRQHPRRQDPDDQARDRPGRLRAPVADGGHARRRRPRDQGIAGRHGRRRLRHPARRDGRRRPVGDAGGGDDRHLPAAGPGPHRRPAPGDQEGRARAGRRRRREQGRRPARGRGPPGRPRAGRRAAAARPARGRLVDPGRHLQRPHRERPGRGVVAGRAPPADAPRQRRA